MHDGFKVVSHHTLLSKSVNEINRLMKYEKSEKRKLTN